MISRVPRLPPALPLVVAPVARPAEIPSMRALDVPVDTRRVETGGLAGAAARALAGEYVPAPDVPTRSKPADPPTPRDNFKQAASETLLSLARLEGSFDAIAQLDPDSQPLYMRLRGLKEAIGDRLYNAMDPTTMPQDHLLALLRAVDSVRQRLADDSSRPDPGSEEGRREIESLFDRLDSALLVPHGTARPPSPGTNFRHAAMEEISVLKALMGYFDPLSQLETDSQPLFRKIAGLHQALTDRVFDARNPQGMSQADLLTLLRAAREIKQQVGAKDFKAPDPRTPEGRREIEALFARLPVFVSYRPADPPTDRQNFKQAAGESLSILAKLEGTYDAFARLDEPSRSQFLRVAGLSATLGARAFDYHDTSAFTPDQLLGVLRVAREIRRKFSDPAFAPDPGTADGRRELEALFARLDSALALPSTPSPPPSFQDNFRQGGMEALAILNRLGGVFDGIAQLEADSQPLFLKLGGLINTLGDRLYGYRRLGSLHPANLAALLKTLQAIRGVLGDKERHPDPRTADGRSRLDGFVTTLASQIGLPFA